MTFKVGFMWWERIYVQSFSEVLILFKALLMTPLVIWDWGQPYETGEYLPWGRVGPLVRGGRNVTFGWASRYFNFRWGSFTYKCPWYEAIHHGVYYAVKYEMNRMSQVREFVASGGKNQPWLKLNVEEVRKANGL